VWAEAGVSGEQKQMVCLYVKDNGIGFDEKHLERIFQPFQRLQGRSEYEGTGMGLAICHKIVDRHHGTITAISQPGNGATFIVTLPLVQPVLQEILTT
jgi:signal transduction histidine kinase